MHGRTAAKSLSLNDVGVCNLSLARPVPFDAYGENRDTSSFILIDTNETLAAGVDTRLETCIARDPEGLYRRALAGEIRNFTGVDQPYEGPEAAELHLKVDGAESRALADQVITYVTRRVLV
jgi:adenylylsulfate kinase-like enzyme